MIYRRIQWMLSRAVITYGVAIVFLFVLADYKHACTKRLDMLVQWGDYPMLYDKKSAIFSEVGLRKAIHYYKILAEGFPSLDQPHGMVGYCYWVLGDKNLAIKYYQEAKKRRPDGFWYDYNLGVLRYDLGDKEEALVFFKNIVEYDSRKFMEAALPASLSKLSRLEQKNFYKMALDFAEQIRDLSWRNIIKINFDRQQYEEVINMALAVKRDPFWEDKMGVLLYAGAAAYMAGQFEIALVFFTTALEQQPDQIWARKFFILAKRRLEEVEVPNDKDVLKQFLGDPVLFPAAIGKVVLHPWSYDIFPGKESFL